MKFNFHGIEILRKKYYLSLPLSASGSDLTRVRSVERVHPDPPFNPLESILLEDSENKFYFG
tara:strand:+ start:825 stop:1010 length:186 start_codon:yes stop_codon:yes gene_type:complete